MVFVMMKHHGKMLSSSVKLISRRSQIELQSRMEDRIWIQIENRILIQEPVCPIGSLTQLMESETKVWNVEFGRPLMQPNISFRVLIK
mmetsp:Transcript_28467/g.77091  ORF Transcript_28467/g.77091 Transcript_28467/m.77091 type:complete len:88 (+) Transcript_28467:1843-2106(+)